MGLYHLRLSKLITLLLYLMLPMVGCTPPQPTQAQITIRMVADGQISNILISPGSTVETALDTAGIKLNPLDRTEPSLFTVLGEGIEVRVLRVTESFEVAQEIIPFESQILRNESLPQDQEILIQRGKNGSREITYRLVFEDGIEISSQPIPVKSIIIEEALPEIRMVGVQAPFSPIQIPGRIIYLRDGNVWVLEGTTASRRALLTTGDLDGRIFKLSRDGDWLLFTRRSKEEGQINSLWVANLVETIGLAEGVEGNLIDLEVPNVVHFADFSPIYDDRIIFSSVEPRAAAPGWQANNELVALTFSETGWTTKWSILVEANSGGVYGWWGMHFEWSPDGEQLAFARPDGVGLVNFETGTFTTTMPITPLQTRGDWAWVPGITWGPDSKILYTIDHPALAGSASPEQSTLFDLAALPLSPKLIIPMISQVGMFAYPITSPVQRLENGSLDYQIAYLQALFPGQSETSRYRLAVMDRDGSNRKVIFPQDETSGMQPDQNWGAWSPTPLPESGNPAIAVIYQGNLWIIDTVNGNAVQVTGDELTNRVIWANQQTLQ